MNHQKEIENKKELIVEEYAVLLEKQEKLSPIAARIISLLLIDNRVALTFDELLNYLKASKSTVSTNLKSLGNAGFVEYFTKSCDRKRYFCLSESGYKLRIEEILKSYQQELSLIKKIMAFKDEANQITHNTTKRYRNGNEAPYTNFLSKIINCIKST
ncbi:transcriptional regulator [Marinifilum breve]|uniref:Transcriptional regulator n=1 Tax=Marinifilum breve TaxID=2184082 RepID=A0A2V3ZZW6_9BACT|nr:ArsR family transcriptional regulator [Marinifilum breve]PXY01999.1 transcriptional regulator [Marinifilum breve]